jgi:DNA-binding GntR family transcriptional regulator
MQVDLWEQLSLSVGDRDSDEAYTLLKKMIITLELAPGMPIKETDLATMLGIGRTPIREALHRLAEENLVVTIPRRGTVVADVSLTELQSIVELRMLLEVECGRLAAERITPAELAELERLLETSPEDSCDSFSHVMLDWQFHRLVAQATRNRYLAETLERLGNLSLRMMYLTHSRMSKVTEQMPEYQNIISALKNRDADEAARQLRQHVLDFRERVLSFV